MTELLKSFPQLCYLAASVLFVLGLKRLSSPKTARSGNGLAALGMALAVGGTMFLPGIENFAWIAAAVAIGTIPGWKAARSVPMTAMPQMVSIFNGMGGACALFISVAEFLKHGAESSDAALFGILLGTAFGAVSFTGSIIAYGKLQGIVSEKQVRIPFQSLVGALLAGTLLFCSAYVLASGDPQAASPAFYAVAAIALVLGVLQVLPIGGADMPVVISVLNSCTGMAAAVTGFSMRNMSMIIAGTLVGAAGSFLTLLMCKAMNRSLANVLFGSFGSKNIGASGPVGAGGGIQREINASETAVLMAYSRRVIIIPGYGLAVAQGQHLVHELDQLLEKKGVDVKYAIHPVAGRMPGHMNVLLAESNVPYPKLIDLDEINPEFKQADVALVIGANDVVNPAARTDRASPIFGMPILDADHAQHIIVMKRGRGVGFAGIDNGLFYDAKTRMLFGDAKATLKELVSELKAL
ncbi:MAG: NAD(P)(+) transhydrogenase (Re/Si-specific) subunit beta [Deltaproteobacteria bacterium]|nr:NAD(P)(+) transhydrogenase (Re/Si-specific) subunit beta [Deltaproteobacteria bacterium]